jgi:predicted alpha/beta-hydrolase family hydrolase
MTNIMPTYNHLHDSKSNTLYVILHGGNKGIHDPFLHKIYNKITTSNQSYITIQMPYFDRGESQSSTPETTEEMLAIDNVLSSIDCTKYQQIRFIGKSLGGLVLSRCILNNPKLNTKTTHLTILGYLVEHINLKGFNGNLEVIQGDNDPYGSITEVQKSLDLSSIDYNLKIVKGGDHSYRNAEKDGVFQDQAVELIQL